MAIVERHSLVVAAIGIEIDRGGFDRLVGQGVQRDLRPLDRFQVALMVDRLADHARVAGIDVVNALDDDRRRCLHGEAKFVAGRVSRHDAIFEVLLDSPLPFGQLALEQIAFGAEVAWHGSVDDLAVVGAVDEAGRSGRDRSLAPRR